MLKGIEYIKNDPIHVFLFSFKKIAYFIFPSFHREDIYAVYGFNSKYTNTIGIISGTCSAALILFGVIGLVLSKKDLYWKTTISFIILYLLIVFIAYGSPRYRDQVDNLLIVYMSQIVIQGKEMLLDIKNYIKKYSRMNIYIILVIITYLLLNWIWVLNEKW
jgi:hypothetical protein